MRSNHYVPVNATSHNGVLCTQQINEDIINTTISQLKAKMEESSNASLLPIIDALKDCWLLELAKHDGVGISQGILKERIARHAQALRKKPTRLADDSVFGEPDQDNEPVDTKQIKRRSRFRSLDGGAPDISSSKSEYEVDPDSVQQFKDQLLIKDQCLPSDDPKNVICGQLQIKEFKELTSMLSLPSYRSGPYFLENGFATLNGKTVYFHRCLLFRVGHSPSRNVVQEPKLKQE